MKRDGKTTTVEVVELEKIRGKEKGSKGEVKIGYV